MGDAAGAERDAEADEVRVARREAKEEREFHTSTISYSPSRMANAGLQMVCCFYDSNIRLRITLFVKPVLLRNLIRRSCLSWCAQENQECTLKYEAYTPQRAKH